MNGKSHMHVFVLVS